MIRDNRLIDKLIADLHFHNFLFVNEGENINIFVEKNEDIENLQSIIEAAGFGDVLNAHTDFYHGGIVNTEEQVDYINEYIDDVFIDYFFRTYKFKEIIFPKGLCYERITPNGIIHPHEDITLNLNDIYDRCTFSNNIFRLFGVDKILIKFFPDNNYIKSFNIDDRIYGLHSWCGALINNNSIFEIPFEQFLSKYYDGKSLLRTDLRGRTIKEFYTFLHQECSDEYVKDCSDSYYFRHIYLFKKDYSKIKNSNIFGDYTIEDILMIYSLLINKFLLDEDSFLLSLCHCVDENIGENKILNDFILFEENNRLSKTIEPFIKSKDLYLRFASHIKSKVFTFEPINDVLTQIKFFGKKSVVLLSNSNSLPLPYYYNLKKSV